MPDPFEILGVDADAADDEIEEAYRRRVIEAHPDHGGSAREFQRVRAAYRAIQAGEYDAPVTVQRETIDTPRQTESRIEYLNYEVLDDFGWSIGDDDLFAKAADADLDPVDYGRFIARPGDSLLQAAEHCGFAWPYACRGGACANCAVALTDGELSQPVDHILPDEMTDRGIRLSCQGKPITDELQVVYNVKHLPELDDLRLPPHPFRQAYGSD